MRVCVARTPQYDMFKRGQQRRPAMNLRVTFAAGTPPELIGQICESTRLSTYHVLVEPNYVRRVTIPDNDWNALGDVLKQLMMAEEVRKIKSRTHPVC